MVEEEYLIIYAGAVVELAAQPSGWCRTYKAKEQKAWL